MADRRMFTKKITEADEFTAMPPTAQALYFHLCMNCDDDGFSNQIRQAMFNAHASTDDMTTLVNKRFVIPFESGVIVIKHWKMHNIIRNDRYHETQYLEEKSRLLLKENGVYTERVGDNLATIGIPNDNQMETEVSIGKVSIDKVSNTNSSILPKQKEDNPAINDYFERVWKLYPKKLGKGQVSKTQKAKLFRIDFEEMKRAIERYKADITKRKIETRYIMHGSTFFNSGYVDYLDANYEEGATDGHSESNANGYDFESITGHKISEIKYDESKPLF